MHAHIIIFLIFIIKLTVIGDIIKAMKYRIISLGIFFIAVFGFFVFYSKSTHFADTVIGNIHQNLATAFQEGTISAVSLKDKYNLATLGKAKINVLVVPGHEPDYGGAEYKNLKERDMNVELAGYLEGFLKSDTHYGVTATRDINGWNPDLAKFFSQRSQDIIDFADQHNDDMLRLINDGSIVKIARANRVVHNDVSPDVAMRLYGINMWADENKTDMLINIHFNDFPRRNTRLPGKVSGFTIYVPEKQYSNASTTRALAESVYARLAKYNAVSNAPKESSGIIDEQNLIAIGTSNTLDAPSMLIEYDYIYETQFSDPKTRSIVLKDLAYETYLGIQDFFGDTSPARAYDTLLLPHVWNQAITENKSDKVDVLALQTALMTEGLYPVPPKNKNNCPRSGKFGKCTIDALNEFQKKYGIKNEDSIVGKETVKVLNKLFSS